MYMAHFHTKMKKGRPYLYVREIKRVNGKPKVVSQVYIGSPERVRDLVRSAGDEEATLHTEEWGSLFVANQADRDIDLVEIVDSVIPHLSREKGPSVGEYFLYAVLNRMVDPQSKHSLPEWYARTAIQTIRPTEIGELTSERYWYKWDRVSEADLEKIARMFFEKVWAREKTEPDCVLFDTTNYYTYMSTSTVSDLAKRGKNKDGKHHLRQVGLALLVARGNRLPLFYRPYPGNVHDSREFEKIMDEILAVVCGFAGTKKRLTLVMDKGMNSEDNLACIDDSGIVHFITTYSPYFADDLATIPLEKFSPIDVGRNEEEPLMAYRTTGEFWGRNRSVVVTYNPRTARKQEYVFEAKLEELRKELLAMRAKVNNGEVQWRDQESVIERYHRLCEKLHVSSALYELTFEEEDGLKMGFRLNAYRVSRTRISFGKSIVVTDNTDWSTEEIVRTHIDRYQVEMEFRQSKAADQVSVMPVRHWTDSKIRCHLFTCVVAMTYLRLLELDLERAGIKRTASDVIEELRSLDSVLTIPKGARTPRRRLATPSKTQALVLHALGYSIDGRGVLQQGHL